jgi:hypothetical protein
MNRRLFVLAALALAGCASAGAPSAPPLPGELEPVYSARAGRDALTVEVASNGCTAKADFAFFVERRGDAVTVAFGRKRLDTCKSFAVGRTALSFTWADLGIAPRTPVLLFNPLTAWTGP